MTRIATVALATAWLAVCAATAWYAPLSGSDWGERVWRAEHASLTGGAWWSAFAAAHAKLGAVLAYAIVHAPWLHAVVTPLAGLALVVGLFAIARRRLPRAGSLDDLRELILLSALIWIVQPRCGLVWFYRSYAAREVWCAALVVWVIAPIRGGWRVTGAWRVLHAIGALLVGLTTPQLAALALVPSVRALLRTPRAVRAGWMRGAVALLVLGTVAGLAIAPRIEIVKVFKRGLEPNLALFALPLREGGELIALACASVLLALVARALRPRTPDLAPTATQARDLADVPGWLAGWLGLAVLALCGPQYSEATLVPASLALCIGALPVFALVARVRWLRTTQLAIALAVHVIVAATALATYQGVGAEYATRMALLSQAPAGTVASVPPYAEIRPDFWFFGEDFGDAAQREQVARDVFGLRDIAIEPRFRLLELNPGVELHLVTSATPAQLAAAGAAATWAGTLGVARGEFTRLVAALDKLAPDASASLEVTGFAVDASRPVRAAWRDATRRGQPHVGRSGPDQTNTYTVSVDADTAAAFPEAWVLGGGRVVRGKLADDAVKLQPMVMGVWAVVLCNPQACLLADAFAPRF